MEELILSNLPKLTTIGEYTFAYNKIKNITLNNLPQLTTVGEYALLKNVASNKLLAKIVNTNSQLFNWSYITGSDTSGQIFNTGTIIHQNGNIQVVLE